jgi:phosphoserine phosphatase RsbU/P
VSYEEASVVLQPGDVLVAYTDGVPEARNTEGEDFGEDRLKSLLRAAMHLPADEISARISHALKHWIQDAEQHDDLTFIVMKVNE